MSEYISAKDTAALIRKALHAAHPNAKFSVRTDTYAGGAAIQVTYVDGPAEATIKTITDQFEGSHFDGMTDILSPVAHTVDGKEVHYLADFVFVTRNISEGSHAAIRTYLRTTLGVEHLHDAHWYSADQTAPIAHATGTNLPNGHTGYGLVRLLAEHPEAIHETTPA